MAGNKNSGRRVDKQQLQALIDKRFPMYNPIISMLERRQEIMDSVTELDDPVMRGSASKAIFDIDKEVAQYLYPKLKAVEMDLAVAELPTLIVQGVRGK